MLVGGGVGVRGGLWCEGKGGEGKRWMSVLVVEDAMLFELDSYASITLQAPVFLHVINVVFL